jgi:hypothetical protein
MTLRRAKRRLAVQHPREGFGPGSEVRWKLPEEPSPITDHIVDIPAQPSGLNTYDKYVSKYEGEEGAL